MEKHKNNFWLSISFILIALVAGSFLTRYFRNLGLSQIKSSTETTLSIIASNINNTFSFSRRSAAALAGSPWVAPIFLRLSPENLQKANSVLDLYKNSLNLSVCYLMDSTGLTIASSNRNAPDSFVGHNYAFRPYFQEALAGRPTIYLAYGITSLERGFFASHPVKDGQGRIIGVAVIKKNVTEVENLFRNQPLSFYVSPDGVIFITGSPNFLFKSLWPINPKKYEKIKNSRQFGDFLLVAVLKKEVQNGQDIFFQKKWCLVSRRFFGLPGWSLVFFTPLESLFFYILPGILITLFMCSIIVIQTSWVHRQSQMQTLLKESEDRFSNAFEASAAGAALLELNGRFQKVNQALCKILEYSPAELLTKTEPELSHPDDLKAARNNLEQLLTGSITDLRMEKRYLRKTGEPVWVMLSLSLVRDADFVPLYLVAQVEDISQQKNVASELQKKIEEFEKFNRFVVDRELKMIELKNRIKELEKQLGEKSSL